MDLLICVGALAGLIYFAYRGHSVVFVAPLAAMAAVLLTQPAAVAPAYSGIFMAKAAIFIGAYFPVFLLGAIFGKLMEASGAARSIVLAISQWLGPQQAILAIALVGTVLTYGGVLIFVVVFSIYPLAATMFREADIPKRLIPATIGLGVLTGTMDALPGTPQIANIIPTTFFHTDTYAAPILGTLGAIFAFAVGWFYLDRLRRSAKARGEGYGTGHLNEPEAVEEKRALHPLLALLPLMVVGVGNRIALVAINRFYGQEAGVVLDPRNSSAFIVESVSKNAGIWAVEFALLAGIVMVAVVAPARIVPRTAALVHTAVGGAILAALNTASEYGFGGVISTLPGFTTIGRFLAQIPNPLVNVAVITNLLSGITGSSSGGLSLTLGAFAERFIAMAHAHDIPLEVMHRVSAMASGGMDTLPHNGVIVTLLLICGLTHRQAYIPIFGLTLIKTAAAFFVIGIYETIGVL
jgi:H+/gluconate symporter-like permease